MTATSSLLLDGMSRYPLPNAVIDQLLTTMHEENLLNDSDVDISPMVAKEFFPGVPRQVYAFQFFRTRKEGKPLLNIATWIPAITHSGTSPLMWQQKEGRPYSVEISGQMDITDQLCRRLHHMYGESSMLPALEDIQISTDNDLSSVEQLRAIQIDLILEMIQFDGVLPAMRTLSGSIPLPADNKVERPNA